MTFIKWAGTITLILANVFRACNLHLADMLLTLTGALLWSYAAYKHKDSALMSVNIFSVLVMIVGIYNR